MRIASYSFLINNFHKTSFLFCLIFLLSSCASQINKKTYIDAKLMPKDVAHEVLMKELNVSNIEGFYMYPQMKYADPLQYYFCDYQDPRYFKLDEVEIDSWQTVLNYRIFITSKEKFDEIGYPCTDVLSPQFKKYLNVLVLKTEESQKQVIDALVSLGVSINYDDK